MCVFYFIFIAELVVQIYTEAVKACPANEEYHTHLFMALVRIGDYKRQQQVGWRWSENVYMYTLKRMNENKLHNSEWICCPILPTQFHLLSIISMSPVISFKMCIKFCLGLTGWIINGISIRTTGHAQKSAPWRNFFLKKKNPQICLKKHMLFG